MANEKRLIDANELMAEFRRYMVERYDRERCVSEENCKTCEKSCLWRKIISVAPTVDAVEVVHGWWIRKQIGKYTGADEVCCSICGSFVGVVCSETGFRKAIEGMNYCPNCGAKMDGDGNA